MKTRVTVNEVKQKIEKTRGDKVEVLLKANHIFKSFMSNTVLNDISIELHSGECLALIGENGAGKSTLMKILTGIYKMDRGEIEIRGKQVQIQGPIDAQRAELPLSIRN